uniref:G-protein coupled receptors family 1 profile domain-containing protein n=1 Tax=Knipowitschia caucasica TaxID=637954 RepID=A0AAV2LZ32_KNICA
MFFPKTYRKGAEKCFDTTSKDFVEDYLKYSVGWTLTGFCLPFLVTVGCYTHVVVKLCGSANTDRQLKRRSLRLLLVLMLLFSVCYIPYHVLRSLNLCSRVLSKRKQCHSWSHSVYVAHQVSRGLVCLNSALNPLVYLHVSEQLSSGLRALMGRTRRVLHSHKMSSVAASTPLQAPALCDAPGHVTDQM